TQSTSTIDLVKAGAGTMVLEGDNTNKGDLVSAGTLLVNGSQPNAFMEVESLSGVGSVLGGRGFVGRTQVNGGGILGPGSPDSAPGLLSVLGPLDFDEPGSTYLVQLNGTAPTTQYDQVRTSGPVILTGAPTLVVQLNFQPTSGDTFTIIENVGTGPTGPAFAGLPEGSTFTVGTWQFTISYEGGAGNDVVPTYNGVHGPNVAPQLQPLRPQALTAAA